MQANPDCAGRVATHQHRSSQVLAAGALGLPILLLVRAPRDAVTSLLALAIQNHQLPALDRHAATQCLAEALRRYARFHERCLVQPKMVVAGFDEVTGDFGRVTRQVNARFGTEFVPFNHCAAEVKALFARTRPHLSPDSARDRVKDSLQDAFDSASLAALRMRAAAAYEAMMTVSERQREDSAG